MFKRRVKKAPGLCTICFSTEGVAIAHALFDDGVRLTCCTFIEGTSFEALKPAIEEFIATHQLTHCDTALVLRSSDYRLFFLDAPNVPEAERCMAAKFLVKDLIDFPFESAAIDVFEVPNRPGGSAKVYVVAMRLERLEEMNARIKELMLNPVSVSISELAINTLTAASPESESSIAFLFKDSQSMHVLLSKEGVLRMVREIGPVSMLRDPSKHERLVLELQRSLDFYQSQLAEMPPVKLFVTPRIAKNQEAVAKIQEMLTIPVAAFHIDEVLPNFTSLDEDARNRCLPVVGELQRFFSMQGGEA